jgi:hypothetical protein
MGPSPTGPVGRDDRARLRRAFEQKGWRELKREERLDFDAQELEDTGLTVAFERGYKEHPPRLAVTNDREPAEELSDPLSVVRAILNSEGRELGWALVGLSWRPYHDPEVPAVSGQYVYATFAPLGRSLDRRGPAGRQQVSDEVVLDILIMRGEGKGPRTIANEMNRLGERTARDKEWRPRTVQAVLESDYAVRIVQEIDAKAEVAKEPVMTPELMARLKKRVAAKKRTARARRAREEAASTT